MTVDEIRELMKEPRIRLAVALHEAGHVLYGRRAGAVGEKYHGPLEHPDRPGEFGAAGVELVFPTPGITVESPAIARWLCAGSVVKRILCPHLWAEDEDASDYDEFCRYVTPSLDSQEISDAWKEAQREVERHLRSPAFRQELWALAREIEMKIPW
jgi:hypothetical protein